MALSNWDTLAVNEKKESTNGVFQTPLGVKVEIYKNWLYVHDKAIAKENDPYVDDVVMEIQEGELTYRDLHVKAIRGPNDGIYAVCWFHQYENKKKPDRFEFMLGTGIYGFDDKENWVGVTQFNINVLISLFKTWTEEDGYRFKDVDPFAKNPRRFNQGDAFFNDNLEDAYIPPTPPGEAEEPVLLQALKGQK
jgi:hypothetical protein